MITHFFISIKCVYLYQYKSIITYLLMVNASSNSDDPQARYGYIPNDTTKKKTSSITVTTSPVRLTSQTTTPT